MAERKLSELIREGAKKRPQVEGEMFDVAESGEIGSCALGAASEAYTQADIPLTAPECYDVGRRVYTQFSTVFQADLDSEASCSFPGGWACNEIFDLGALITHLNDEHNWSRERIADHIASLGY